MGITIGSWLAGALEDLDVFDANKDDDELLILLLSDELFGLFVFLYQLFL